MVVVLEKPAEITLPQGPGFQLISRVKIIGLRMAIAEFDYDGDEILCLGDHFPGEGNLVMPGVVVLETLAQTAILAAATMPELVDKRPWLAGFDHVRFHRPVRPSTTLVLNAEIIDFSTGYGLGHAKGIAHAKDAATDDLYLVAEAKIIFAAKGR